MELTIDINNFSILSEDIEYPHVTILKVLHLPSKTLNLKLFPNLKELKCEGLNLTQLDLSSNLRLEKLNCSVNKLTELDLSSCRYLKYLYCDNNYLTKLDLSSCLDINGLCCNNNKLTHINSDSLLESLMVISCDHNLLTELTLKQYPNLNYLYCNYNLLKELDVTDCRKIFYLSCQNNRDLTHISNSLIFLDRLKVLLYSNCPLELTRLQLEFIYRMNRKYNKRTIFEDAQNVHDSHIVKCIKDSLCNIFRNPEYKNDKSCVEKMLQNEKLTNVCKQLILEFIEDESIHTVLEVNFRDIFEIVYPIIEKYDVCEILNSQMEDSECKCFTGRISRLIGTLDKIIPEVNITIGLSEDLNIIASMCMEKYSENVKENFLREVLEKYPELNNEDGLSYLKGWTDNFN